MTKREFLTNVANGTMTDELKAFAAEEIVKMDAALEKRKTAISPKRAANMELADILYEALPNEALTASAVYALGIEGITSVSKATAVLKVLAADGRVTVGEVKVKNTLQKAYTKA